MKGNLEVGTDSRATGGPPPRLLLGTCREGWWLPEIPSEMWQRRGLYLSLLPPSPVSV